MSENLPKKLKNKKAENISPYETMGLDTQMKSNNADNIPIVMETTDYELDRDLELIKYEFNMIELPFFSKDKTIGKGVGKVYSFSGKKKQFMQVVPSANPLHISNKIPQEFDEKVFYGILKLSQEQGSDTVITDFFTLAKVSQVPYKNSQRLRDSLQRLRWTGFEFHNIYYEKKDGKRNTLKYKDLSILQEMAFITVEDAKLKEEFRQYRKYFRNGKIKEIIIIVLSQAIYSNMMNKAFLYLNQQTLLDIDNATARKLYLLLYKWSNWEKNKSDWENKLRRSCRFIASRLPLSWESYSVPITINHIDASASLLKAKNLISDYVLIRTKPLSDSYIDFYFGGETNKVLEYNKRAAAVTTGQENLSIESCDDFLDDRQTTIFEIFELSSEVKEIFEKLPDKYKTDAVKKIFKNFENRGFDYVKSNVDYSLENCSGNFSAYLYKALNDDFAADQRQQEEIKRKKEQERKEKEAAAAAAEKARKEELERKAREKYQNMSEEEKEAFHQKLRKKPFFEMFLKSLDNDISQAAIFTIASDLAKDS